MTETTTIRRRLVIRGRVQGVFFRNSVRERSMGEELAGWARNREDGTVEVVLEGRSQGVQSVIDFCRQGPSRAEVGDVEIHDEEPEGLSGFQLG